ncbi:MAG: hypothetical protein OEV66_05145 [Spirochaetia bacterium]|nr:hypothetical protein [Spirochaetia bacterium]
MKQLIKTISVVLLFSMASLRAEEAEHQTKNGQPEEHEEHAHSNHFSLFLGLTSALEANTHEFTAGLDYEYRLPVLNRLLGVGVLADFAFGHETTGIFAGFIGIHPVAGLKILVAPGIETLFSVTPATAFLIRGSIGYDIMIDTFSVTPIISADYVPESRTLSLVYGLAAGIGF